MSQISPTPLYLDVRTPQEHAAERIEHSLNVPVEELPLRLMSLGSLHRRIVVFCRSGRRSAVALQILKAAGFTQVRDAGAIQNVRTA